MANGFLQNAISGIKLPEAKFSVSVEQDSLNRIAKTILVVVFFSLVMAFVYKKSVQEKK